MSEVKRSLAYMEDKDREGFFKDYHKVVRKSVPNDQFEEFGRLKTDEDRIRFLLKLPAIDEIEIKPFYKGKSEREALAKKEAGNRAFAHKNNLEALKLYSQAVVKAPIPSEENADPKKMTLYAICLANRSAALYYMREYYYCIRDIEEALEHHYPKELKYKLYKRKGRLLSTYKRHIDARDSFRQSLKWVDWAKMEREKRIDQQTEIQKWLRLFESAKELKNAPWEEETLYPTLPDITDGPNNKFPSLTSKVDVKYGKGGRHIIATEDIQAGDTICVEKPYSSVLLYEQFGTHCQNCFLLTKAPIPCKNCSSVLFCSVDCRNSSYFHKIECSVLDLLHGSGMSINCFLSLRIITQKPLSYFLDIKDRLVEEDPQDILNEEKKYDTEDFVRIYNLVRHSEQRTPEDFFHRSLMAVFLMKVLKETKYFSGQTKNSGETTDTEIFIGSLLLRMLQVVQFNAHEVSEFELKGPCDLEESENVSLGAAIYPTLALFNHTCQTSQVRYFSGNSVITQAVRSIAKGEEVPENYGQSYVTKDKNQRRVELAERYWFQCACQVCEEDWPSFDKMDTNTMSFKCKECQSPLPLRVDSPQPIIKCQNCNTDTNIFSALKNLQNSEKTFKAAVKEMQCGNIPQSESLLLENLKQLDSCLCPPFRDYHLTQEALMKCMLTHGNKRVRRIKDQ